MDEVPPPLPPAERRREPVAPTLHISRSSEWVGGMQRSIREFALDRACPEPLVRVTLDDGEQVFLRAMTPGPDDDFVTMTAYEAGGEQTRVVVVRLDAIRKVDILATPPTAAEAGRVFHPRAGGVGFALSG